MAADATQARRKTQTLVLLAMAQFVVVLDATIVNVALPTIQRALDFSQDSLSWIVNGYTLTFGGFLLLGGRAADLLGRRKVFIAGILLFTFASLACGLATGPEVLIAARALQGLGGAILSPTALSIVTNTFAEGAERNRALGIWGAIAGVGASIGILLGGMLTEWLSWEWVFFVNVPVGIVVAFLAPRVLEESYGQRAGTRFDALGALTITAGLVVLVYGIVEASDAGWLSGQTLGLLALAAVLIGAFLVVESRSRSPLVRLGIFRIRSLSSSNALMLLAGMALFGTFFLLSLYMQQILRLGPLETGVRFLTVSAVIIVVSGITSQVVTRTGVKPPILGGLLLVSLALLLLSGVAADGSWLNDVLPGSLVLGAGLGMTFVPLTVAATANVHGGDAGLASGLFNTSQQIGGALGLAILATVANRTTESRLGDLREAPTPPVIAQALTEGYQAAFVTGAILAFAGAVVALVLLRNRDVPASQLQPGPAPA